MNSVLAAAAGRIFTAVQHQLLSRIWRAELRINGVEVDRSVLPIGRPIVARAPGSRIIVGVNASLISTARATALGVSRPVVLRTLRAGAEIAVGQQSGLSGTTVVAARSVTIGARVLLGADVMIADTDFHPVDAVPRRYVPMPEPTDDDAVRIEDDVFVGARSIILRGVTIGAGSMIGAGSVVTRSIPAGVVAAGNPCRPLRELKLHSPPAGDGSFAPPP